MSFATLQEAWGVTTFGVEEIKPEKKAVVAQREVLDQAEASQRSVYFVTQFLRDVYDRHGVAGITSLLDDRIMSDIRMEAVLSFDWVDTNTLLMLFMCICGLWLIMDILRR